MKIINYLKEKISGLSESDLRKRIDDGEAILKMTKSEGWKILSNHFNEQMEAYIDDNATNATDWNDYLKKSGKIFGMKLLLTDIQDFIRMSEDAKEKLEDR